MKNKVAMDFEGISGDTIATYIEDKNELLEIANGQIEVNEIRLASAETEEINLRKSLADMSNPTDILILEQELENLLAWRTETIEHTKKLREAVVGLTKILARMRT